MASGKQARMRVRKFSEPNQGHVLQQKQKQRQQTQHRCYGESHNQVQREKLHSNIKKSEMVHLIFGTTTSE
jgi:hypothetical protein